MTTRILQIVPCTTNVFVRSRTETDDGAPMESALHRVHLWALVEDTETHQRRTVPMVAGADIAELEAADEYGDTVVLVEEEDA